MDIFRSYGALTTANKTEKQVIDIIKSRAVKLENLTISRKRLIEAKQDRDEPIGAYAAKLKGLASMCQLNLGHCTTDGCTCTHMRSYLDTMVGFVMITGLADTDIQADVLSHTNQTMTLDELIKFIEAREAGKLSSASLTGTQATYAARSSYKRYSNQPTKPATPPPTTNGRQFRPHHQPSDARPTTSNGNYPHCGACRTKTHKFYNRGERRLVCPAYGKTCGHCKVLGHFAQVCHQRRRHQTTAAAEHAQDTNSTFISERAETATILSALTSTTLE